MTMKNDKNDAVKVLVAVHDGFEETEFIAPVDLLRRAGADVTVVSMTGDRIMKGSHGINITSDAVWEEMNGKIDADCLFLPGGGKNANSLRDDKRVTKLARKMFDSGKVVSAICAAPIALERAGILKGKKVTSYPGCLNGDEYEYLTEAVVEDGNLITGRGAGCATEFGLKLVEKLFGRKEALALAKTVMYPHRVK
jgi:4-methyl-5(b-hydroxyethyl)-thiazole monophosphate biosynthesis